jgi:hypothetical protein
MPPYSLHNCVMSASSSPLPDCRDSDSGSIITAGIGFLTIFLPVLLPTSLASATASREALPWKRSTARPRRKLWPPCGATAPKCTSHRLASIAWVTSPGAMWRRQWRVGGSGGGRRHGGSCGGVVCCHDNNDDTRCHCARRATNLRAAPRCTSLQNVHRTEHNVHRTARSASARVVIAKCLPARSHRDFVECTCRRRVYRTFMTGCLR